MKDAFLINSGRHGLPRRRVASGRMAVAPLRRLLALASRGSALCALGLLTSCVTSRPDLVWSKDGRQCGKASWYDDHGDRTANGELFNMRAMTAAHSSLALNSVVEVTHLRNGKKVTVRINDRLPPIHKGRVIDLSREAFRQLGPLNQGLLDVEVRVIQYGDNKYVKQNRAAPTGKMYLPDPGKKNRPKNAPAARSVL